MKTFLKRNWFILTMLTSIVAGCAVGAVWPGAESCLQPIGTIFVNLMFCVVVPMVFCSISSAIANMKGMRRAGKVRIGHDGGDFSDHSSHRSGDDVRGLPLCAAGDRQL